MIDYQIFKNIAKHVSLSTNEVQHFASLLFVRDVQKKELILKQEQICRSIYFVEEGSLRGFNLNDDGKECTLMFAVRDWWITDMNCFINQKAAILSIEALEASKIIELTFDALEGLYKSNPKFERLFRILFQNAYSREQVRALHNISLKTEKRYYKFADKYPAIMKKVTQKQIASYLGVTPEFLSTIKKSKHS